MWLCAADNRMFDIRSLIRDEGGKGVTSAWSPLGNFLEGQAHPNLHRTRFCYFFDVKFFVFAFQWFLHWGCYVYFRIVFSLNSLYILYIFIFIYFIYFFIVLVVPYSALTDCDRSVVLVLDDRPDPQLWEHCGSTHSSSMICFFCVCSGFSLASWRWTGCPKETSAI